ncbi:MAG: class I SAM-dependent methyltransferase [Porphyrobacter sp.]|nr:class I SAM-dependent methyltransferase [Porphyrobacter sp.]
MGSASLEIVAAGAAFDAVAGSFDDAFDPWLSVAAQRASVREELLIAFPAGASLLEIGGGTGTDAAWMIERRREVFLTDAAPAMVAEAARKIGARRCEALPAERLGELANRGLSFDGAYSNFAALNCVSDLAPVARALADLVRPGGKLVLVLFGTCCPGEVLVELARGRPRNCLRRFRREQLTASLRGRRFTIRYHRRADLERCFAPTFRLTSAKAVGLFVPPSAAEPWISRRPRLLAALEAADGLLARRLAWLGDHVAYVFERVTP